MGFFKAYDMRGTFAVDFNLDTVYRVGRALPQVVAGRRWLVGRDGRATSSAIVAALVKGLREAGAEVTDLGLVTTPMVYFFTAQDGFDGSVMVTASHNPPGDNGLKVSRRGALPVGYADGLDRVERLVAADTAAYVPDSSVAAETDAGRLERYARFFEALKVELGALRFAVDCSGGMATLLSPRLFPGAELLNARLDGTFACHSPNPLNAAAREQLVSCVRERGYDCGVIFDGDADRAMFVDERGEFVQSDYLIPLVADFARRHFGAPEGAAVVHDVRTSRGAIEALGERGYRPVMVPVGHAFAKPRLRAEAALCGGELAGHYYFRDFFACDSGVLAALAVLEEVARAKAAGVAFSELMRPIVSRYANSGELNYRVADQAAAIARVLAVAERLAPVTLRSELDGVRLEFAEGWVSVRKSNTEPYLRLLVERRGSRAALAEWVAKLEAAIHAE